MAWAYDDPAYEALGIQALLAVAAMAGVAAWDVVEASASAFLVFP